MKPLKFILPAALLFSFSAFAQDEELSPPPPPPKPPAVSLPSEPPPPPPPRPIKMKHKGDIQKIKKMAPPQEHGKPIEVIPAVPPQPVIKEK
jgi:hypothetical protein